MARAKRLRYIVDGSEKSYADPGPAISLSVTLASRDAKAGLANTYYVRDAVTGEPVGYSETQETTRGWVVVTATRTSRT